MSPGPVSSGADFGKNLAGCPGPVPADFLDDLSRALAILQRVRNASLGPGDPSGESSIEGTNRARLLGELPASNRERPLRGSLFSLLELLAEESQLTAPVGGVMSIDIARYGLS